MPALTSFQVLISSTNTVLGAGTAVGLKGVTGLRELPNLREGNLNRGQQDGSFPGLNFVGERKIGIDYQITTSSGLEAALTLAAASHQNVSDPSTICLTVGDYLRQQAGVGPSKPVFGASIQLPNRSVPIRFFGRPVRYSAPINSDYEHGQANLATEWSCPDGLLYEDTLINNSCGLPNPTSGMHFPTNFNLSFGSSSGGSFQMVNTGAYATAPYFTVTGPVTNPTITNETTGQFIGLNITLTTGDKLGIDCQSGTITLGTANRNTAVDVGTTFFSLAPGTNTIGYGSADSTSVTSTLTGYALPAYSTL